MAAKFPSIDPKQALPQLRNTETITPAQVASNIHGVKPTPSFAPGQTVETFDPEEVARIGVDLSPLDVEGVRGGASDHRVRLKAMSGQAETIYGPDDPTNILQPLHYTDGLLFPYTPTIQFNQDVDYKSLELVHANGESYAYSRTPSVSLSVTGKFSIQNPVEGRFALAAIHFLRVASKMYFGEKDYGGEGELGRAGLPPPTLIFEGLGDYMFNSLKVILRNHTYSIDETAHLVRVPIRGAGGSVRLPSLFTISLSLTVINTPTQMREEFSIDEFRTGALMGKGGWI